MSKLEFGARKANVNNIVRGAYYFGIVGRLSVFWGVLCLLAGLGSCGLGHGEVYRGGVSLFSQSVVSLVYGWLFLLGRDAFDAIQILIQDMGEIV